MKALKKSLALLLALAMTLALLAGCGGGNQGNTGNQGNNAGGNSADVTPPDDGGSEDQAPVEGVGSYIYKDSASTLPANWNPHVYQTADDGVPLDYTTDSLYTMFFNDEVHPLEGKEPFEGYVLVPSMAADMPVDVTEEVKASHPQFNIPESATSGYAWQVKLRDGLCWDDGTPITAQDFVDSRERVLRPELLNYRATEFYQGTYAVVNAKNYALAGSYDFDNNGDLGIQLSDMTKNEEGQYMYGDKLVFIAVNYDLSWCGGDSLKNYVETYGEQYFGLDTWEDLLAQADGHGVAPCTDDNLALLSGVTTTNPNWGETDDDLYNYLLIVKTAYPEGYSFDNVGIFATGDDTLTFVFANALDGFYLLTQGLATWDLVKVDQYDQLLQETTTATGSVWSSTYATSVETSPSYGPYKVSAFQSGKSIHYVRNENWWGWDSDVYTYVDPQDGQTYHMWQTTEIDTQYVKEPATSKQMFLSGQLMGYGLQSEDFDQYRNSEYYYATPAETVFFLLMNGYKTVIDQREQAADFDTATTDLQTQTIDSFRRAFAVSIDRDLFAATVSPQRSGGYGMLGTTYVCDPETATFYRDTPQAKQALIEFYSIDLADYNNDVDAAIDSITGYDPETAKELFAQAYQEALDAGYITDNDNDGKSDQTVTLIYAMSGEVNNFFEKTFKFLNDSLNNAAAGTGFEGKIAITPSAPVGNAWSDNIRQGTMDTELAGWSGSRMDPFSMADTWTDAESAYWGAWWDASKHDMTLTLDGEDITMSIRDWALCLNGKMTTVNGKDYNFGYGQTSAENRLTILAAIETELLKTYNPIPIMQEGGGSLLSQQVYYVVEDYNPMMIRGSVMYMKYNFDEAEWAEYVASQGGTLQY